jgi:hypothetical protein
MATTDGPIGKMLNFMRRRDSRAIVQPEDVAEDGFIDSKLYSNAKPTRDESDKNIPVQGDYVKIPKRLRNKDIELKHKRTKSDAHGEYNVYKAKKVRNE